MTTTSFEGLARRTAAENQLPEARVLVTNHPLGGTAEKTIIQWADESSEKLLNLFLG